MALYTFVLTSFYSSVILPKFKLMEKGTWASTSIAIYLCILSLASFTFARNQAFLKFSLFHFSTCLWILMIFAFVVIAARCVVLASFSCILITFFLSTTFFYITFWHIMPKYWFDVTWDLEDSTNGSIPFVLLVGKLGSNNMLAIGLYFFIQLVPRGLP